ncbi:MAG: hypothetical protein AB1488_04370 [Nitrospirota bacterium]
MGIEEDLRQSEKHSGGRGILITLVILLALLVITGAFYIKRLSYERDTLQTEMIRIQKENEALKGRIEGLRMEIEEGKKK